MQNERDYLFLVGLVPGHDIIIMKMQRWLSVSFVLTKNKNRQRWLSYLMDLKIKKPIEFREHHYFDCHWKEVKRVKSGDKRR